MTEKICKNCWWWESKSLIDDDIAFRNGDCSSKKFVYYGDNDQKLESDCLSYWDIESYGAGFNTGENFGCIHWVSKEEEIL